MRKSEVVVGGTYQVKVSGRICPVKLTVEHPAGGYIGFNLWTKRPIRIRSAARLRGPFITLRRRPDQETAGPAVTVPQGGQVVTLEAELEDAIL